MPFPLPNGRYLTISGDEGVIHSGLRKSHSFSVWREEVPEITSLAVAILRNRLNAQRLVPLVGVFVLLSACAQVATVKNVRPLPPSVAAVFGTRPASARDEERSPEVALAHDLDVAAKAWAALKEDPGKAQSRELYNYSVGRVVSLLQVTWKLQDARAVTIGTGSSAYHLTFSSDIKLFDNPAAMPLFSCREKLRRLLKQEGFCSGTVAVCYAVGSLFPEEALALQVGDLRGKFRKECQIGGG